MPGRHRAAAAQSHRRWWKLCPKLLPAAPGRALQAPLGWRPEGTRQGGGGAAWDGAGGVCHAMGYAEPWGTLDALGVQGCAGSRVVGRPKVWGDPGCGASKPCGDPNYWGTQAVGTPQLWGDLSSGDTRAPEAPEGQHAALEELGGGHRAGWGRAAVSAQARTLTLTAAGLSGPSQQQRLCKQRRAEACLLDQPFRKPLPGPLVQSTDTCPTSDPLRHLSQRAAPGSGWDQVIVAAEQDAALGQGGQGYRDGAHGGVTGEQPRP